MQIIACKREVLKDEGCHHHSVHHSSHQRTALFDCITRSHYYKWECVESDLPPSLTLLYVINCAK